MRVPVFFGDSCQEILGLLRECGHDPVLVEDGGDALAENGGIQAPLVVVTNHVSERTPLIRELRAAGVWVLGVAPESELEGLSLADDLLPLPADAAAVRARLRAAGGALAAAKPFFERNPLPMWVFDRETHGILAVNEAAIDRYGWSRDEFLRLRVSDLRPPGDVADFLAQLERRPGQPFSIESAPFQHRARSGELFDVEVHGTSTWFAGRPAQMVLVHDVTERNRILARLLVSDRLLSVGTLASGVAHEINNPLAVTLANLEFALEELGERNRTPDLPETAQALREALEGAQRVARIVRELRTFTRSGGEKRRAVSVLQTIERALMLAAAELRHRARVVRELAEVPAVEGNELQLGQVVLSLLTNAAQAIPEGRGASDSEIRIRTALEGGRVVIEVSDTGVGIPRENLRRIFDPFFTTKAPGQGTGLGLAMCHNLVTSFGGEIAVESTPGAGTTFRVFLPPAGEDVAELTPATTPRPAARRGRILLVDDEPLIARTVERILSAEHEIVVEIDAREARKRIAAGERFDVILCDLLMPEMSGMDLHAEIGSIAPEQQSRMVFLTGGAFTLEAQKFLDRLPGGWVAKPFEAAVLKAAIASRLS